MLLIGPAESAPFQALCHLEPHYQVISTCVESFQAASQYIEQAACDVDVLLADCTAPEWDEVGDGAAQPFRTKGQFRPLISVTGVDVARAASAAARVGAFDYVDVNDGDRLRYAVLRVAKVNWALQTNYLRILNEVNKAVAVTMDPVARVETVLDHIAQALDVSVAGITLTEAMSTVFPTRVFLRGKGWTESIFAEAALNGSSAFLSALAARHEAVVAPMSEMPDLETYPQSGTYARMRSLLAPVVYEGELLAVINVARKQASPPFSDEDRALAIAMADVAATAIHSAHLYVTAESQRQVAEALLSVSSLLTRTLDSNALLQGILDSVSRVLPYDVCAIMRFEGDLARIIGIRVGPDQSVESMSALVGVTLDGAYALRLPIPSISSLADVVRTRQPVITSDTDSSSDAFQAPWMTWVRSAANIPILVGDQLIGCLNLVSTMPRTYSHEQITAMSMFAAQVGAAIFNAQLFEESEARAKRLAIMASVTAAAISSLDLRAVMDRVLETTCHALDAGLGTLLLQDGSSTALTVTHERATGTSRFREARCSEIRGVLAYALEHDRALRIDDLPHDARFDPAWDVPGRPDLTALLCAPLTFHDTFSGVIALARGAGQAFSEAELHLIQSLAPVVALAMANARLFQASLVQAEDLALVNEFGLQLAHRLDSLAIVREMSELLRV